MIEFCAVRAEAGAFQLRDIDLKIQEGDCHVIVGPTGAGKTFLLETLIGLRPLTGGTIRIDGKDISGLPLNARNISYVPQEACLFPTMTVRENIMYGVEARNIDRLSVAPFIQQLITFFNIEALLDRFPANLSGGEKQRVALVRGLAPKPVLLVLDEPFSAIDHSMREEIRRLIKSLLEMYKMTTLVVTHDLDEAFFLGDRLSVIIDGSLRQTGGRDDVYYYPKTFGVASFLGIKNTFRGTIAAIEDGEVVLTWDEMGLTIPVACKCSRKRFVQHQAVRFGIRSEAVHILRPGDQGESRKCLVEGAVRKVYMRGKMHTVLVELDGPAKTPIEIDIHDAAARKIGLVESARIKINLNPKWIFLLSD